MGANQTTEKGSRSEYAWPEEKRQLVDKAFNSGNPKVINFK